MELGVLVSKDRQSSANTAEGATVLQRYDILLKADEFFPTNCDNIVSISYTYHGH